MKHVARVSTLQRSYIQELKDLNGLKKNLLYRSHLSNRALQAKFYSEKQQQYKMAIHRPRARSRRDALMASEPFFYACLPRKHVRVLTRYTPTSGHLLHRDDAAVAAASLRIFRLT